MRSVWEEAPARAGAGDAVAEQLRARLGALMGEWANHVEYAGGDANRTDPAWRQGWYQHTGEVLAALRRRELEAQGHGGRP